MRLWLIVNPCASRCCLEGAGELLIGAEHERQQKIVERVGVARLDKGAARHVDRRMIDREPIAPMREHQDLAIEAREAVDAADEDHVIAPLMLRLARCIRTVPRPP